METTAGLSRCRQGQENWNANFPATSVHYLPITEGLLAPLSPSANSWHQFVPWQLFLFNLSPQLFKINCFCTIKWYFYRLPFFLETFLYSFKVSIAGSLKIYNFYYTLNLLMYIIFHYSTQRWSDKTT